MKKKLNKKLLNLIALCSGLTATVSLGVGGVIYSLRQSDPIYQDFLPDEVYEINSDNVLIGFKDQFLNDPTSKIYKDNFKDCHTMRIPARVTSINETAFYNGSESTIPDFIENLTFAEESKCSSIGNRAFINCLSLTTINFPSNLNEISNGAFINCSSITRIDFSNATNLSSIGQHAFDGCKSITSITLSNNLTTINDSAFVDCTSLTSVDFSNAINLCSIGDGVFNGCSSLVSVDLSKCTNLSLINTFAFNRCSSLTSVIFPSSLKTIDYAAFSHCEKLSSSIDLSNCDNLSSIGNYAFENCSALISVSFPTNLNEIGKYAFTNCPKLNSITWDAWKGNITFPYPNAFSGVCPDGGTVTVSNPSDDAHDSIASLEYLVNNGGLPESWLPAPELPDSIYRIENDVLMGFTSEFLANPNAYRLCNTMRIPARVTSINANAFCTYNQSTYQYVTTIPDFINNLTFAEGSKCSSIGNRAFDSCKSITSITLSNNISSIGDYAFRNCQSFTSIELSNVSSIGQHAFDGCKSITSITLSNNLTKINDSAFVDCTSLTSVDFSNAINLCSIGDGAFNRCIKLSSADLSNCTILTLIDGYAFADCSTLNSVTFPSSLKTIDYAAFSNCTNLSSSIDLSNCINLSLINGMAFENCSTLTSVSFPSSLSEIGTYAFTNCPLLNNITWNAWKGNTSLPYSTAFSGVCPDGGTVTVSNPSDDAHDSIALLEYLLNNGGLPESWLPDAELPDSVYRIENDVLMGFTSEFLANSRAYRLCNTMQIPARVTSINESAFYNGSESTIPDFIENLTFAEGSKCSSIGYHAFDGCKSITSITLSNSLIEIYSSAFKGCTSLTSISFPNSLTTIDESAFTQCSALSSVDLSNATKLLSINPYAFKTCTSLTSVNLPNSLQLIGKGAFVNCSSLTSVNFPNNLTSIGEIAFAFCNLSSVTLPGTLTTIGRQIFNRNANLSSITWNAWNGNTNLQRDSFMGVCSTGGDVTVTNPIDDTHNTPELLNYLVENADLPESWRVLPDSVYNIDENNVLQGFTSAFSANPSAYSKYTTMQIPASVKSIKDQAFFDTEFALRTTIPNFITRLTFAENSNCSLIGWQAFEDCPSLVSAIFPNSLETVSEACFINCSGLNSINFLKAIKLSLIEPQAFYGCSSLISVSFPSSITEIWNHVFAKCSSLNYIAWNLPDDYQTSISIVSNAFSTVSSSGRVESLNTSISSQQLLEFLQNNGLPADWTTV